MKNRANKQKEIPPNPQNTKALLRFASLHLVLSKTAVSCLGLFSCYGFPSLSKLEAQASWLLGDPSHRWPREALGK